MRPKPLMPTRTVMLAFPSSVGFGPPGGGATAHPNRLRRVGIGPPAPLVSSPDRCHRSPQGTRSPRCGNAPTPTPRNVHLLRACSSTRELGRNRAELHDALVSRACRERRRSRGRLLLLVVEQVRTQARLGIGNAEVGSALVGRRE